MSNKVQANLKYHKGYGENFKSLRVMHQINGKSCTVRQLSEIFSKNGIGISYSTISDIENERREPTVEQTQIYHDFFNVPFDFLTGEIKTQKKSLIDICNYTGLSEKAVKSIITHKNCYTGPVVSQILESFEFWEFVRLFNEASTYKDFLHPNSGYIVSGVLANLNESNIPDAYRNALILVGASGLIPIHKSQIYDLFSKLYDKIILEGENYGEHN